MILLLLSAFAQDIPQGPVEAFVPGQCLRVYHISPGKPLPEGLVNDEGNATCGATILPSGKAAYYWRTEKYAQTLKDDLRRANFRLATQDEIYKAQLDAIRPRPIDRPAVQRTIGRLETLVTVAAIAAVYAVATN